MTVSVFSDRPTAAVFPGNTTDEYIFWGRDATILVDLSKYMNFTPIFIVPKDTQQLGNKTESGIFTGALGDLLYERADLIGNEISVKYYGTDHLVFALPALRDQEVVVLVPKSKKLPTLLIVFKDLHWVHFEYVTITILCCVITWNILTKCYFTGGVVTCTHQEDVCSSFLVILQIFMTMPVYFLTRVQVTSQRILISSCLICSWFMVYSFQGLLLDVVSNPTYSPNVDTLEELHASQHQIFTSQVNLLDTFNYSQRFEGLSTNIIYNPYISNLINSMKKYRNISLVTSKRKAKWAINYFQGYHALHIMEDSPASYLMSFMTHKSSPYIPRLRILLGRINQAGLIDKWDDHYDYCMDLNGTTEVENDPYDISSLDMSDVVVAFFLLSVGLAVCVIIFILEVCLKKVS